MTPRVIVLDMPAPGRGLAALLEGGRLEDLLVDGDDGRPETGAVRQGRVDRLVPKANAAFVRLDDGGTGYLRQGRGLREGDRLPVQVTGQAEQGKALPVSRRLLYKDRRIIHTPDAPGINVSRRIGNEAERARLTGIVEAWRAPDTELQQIYEAGGFILRTAARGAPETALDAEIALVLKARRGGAATPEPPALVHALREWAGETPDAIVVAPRAARWVRARLHGRGAADADLADLVRTHDGPDPFEDLGLADQIDALMAPRVDLPSGAWLTVEPTRALVAVDINTGERFSAGAALTANLEAARELPRQLRLRGLGGQVAIDVAPVPKRDRRRIEEALKAALRRDPVETSLAGWSALGLCELSRKRERRPLSEAIPQGFSDAFTRT